MVTPSLAAGGAERSVVLLSAGFLQRRHPVTVITLYGAASDRFELPPGVTRVALDVAAYSKSILQGFSNNLRRLLALRKAIRASRPDIVISNNDRTNVLTRLARY